MKAKRPGLLPAPEPARVLQIAGMREPIELPYLFSFVRFVAVEKTFRVLEFLNDEHQRIHVGLSSEASTDLLMLLRVLPKTKSHQQER